MHVQLSRSPPCSITLESTCVTRSVVHAFISSMTPPPPRQRALTKIDRVNQHQMFRSQRSTSAYRFIVTRNSKTVFSNFETVNRLTVAHLRCRPPCAVAYLPLRFAINMRSPFIIRYYCSILITGRTDSILLINASIAWRGPRMRSRRSG